MVNPIAGRTRPAADAQAWGDERSDEDQTGIRGVLDDLRVLLAIMLGHDMAPRRTGVAGARTPEPLRPPDP